MVQAAFRHFTFSLGACALLIGCVDGAGPGATPGDGPEATAPTPSRAGATGDIEAPEIFQATDSALWDGRPSLGGIWVASPEVTDPQRVVIFNPATGKSVQGALFRRERDNPGPPLQLSSDAAEALGILAGQPVQLKVTALRREVPAAPVAVASEPAADVTAPTAEVEIEATNDVAATAAAALAAADGVTEAAVVDPALAGADVTVPDATPKRKTWKERRAEAKAAREAAAGAAAADQSGEAAAVSEIAASPEAVGVATIETAPLDARNADVAASTDAAIAPEPPKTRRQKRAEAEAAEAAAAAAAALPEVPEAPISVGRPIQVASFSLEENAARAVAALAKAGFTAETRKSETAGKVVWGVVARGDAAFLASIRAAGFADAYFLQ